MKINLPNIVIQPDWTIPSQVKKIGEEYGEVAEAVAMNDPVGTIREALDTMQTCATLINMVLAEWEVPLDRFMREHEEKLAKKGYMGVKIDG
jgi:NTP pyrophosphatase (non-canonical NTP hydrolase)